VSLGGIVDALGTFLLDTVSPRPTLSGGTVPAALADLPAITLSLSEAAPTMQGLGRIPRPPRTGALRVQTSLDLGDPVLRFGDEPPVPLLSNGRQTLQLPHAPLVTADGSPVATLGSADLSAMVGTTTFAVVDAAPAGAQVRPDAATGILLFGAALPLTGTLALQYFVGQWEVRSARYAGLLGVDVTAGDGATAETLSRAVDRALLREPVGSVPGLRGIAPAAWGAVQPSALAPAARVRTMRYRIDYELEEAIIPTGGGVIARIRVIANADSGSEEFEVTG
jgi:hypothetical protein